MITVGAAHTLSFRFDQAQVDAFARLTGDTNPVHTNAEYAAKTRFGRTIVHGAFVSSLISRALGAEFPGPGTIYIAQDVKFLAPVYTDDAVEVRLLVLSLDERGRADVESNVFKADGTQVLAGKATILVPKDLRPGAGQGVAS
jgi:3-hydroxybutyryl-CoA dehydratase